MHEMRNNSLLISDVHRACAAAAAETYQTNRKLIGPSDEHIPETTALTDYDIEKDAMFLIEQQADGSYKHAPLEQQPTWVEYEPEAGGRGQGSPPPYHFRLPAEYVQPPFLPKLNIWKPGMTITGRINFNNPKETGTTSLDAALIHAKPAVYYDPSPLNHADIMSRPKVIRPAGPGWPLVSHPEYGLPSNPHSVQPWPASLTAKRIRTDLKPGATAYDVDSLATATANGEDSEWCIVLDKPPDIPTAVLKWKYPGDSVYFQHGCSQGCKGPNLTLVCWLEQLNYIPTYECYFCEYEHANQTRVLKHMDTCEKAVAAGFTRTPYMKDNNLPPLKSDTCGHVLCVPCAFVSRITAPPSSACPVCGKVAGVILVSRTPKDDPDQDYDPNRFGPALTEIYASGNPLAHHLRR